MPFDNGTFTKLYDWLGNKTDIPRKRGDSLNKEFENFSDGLTDLKSEIDTLASVSTTEIGYLDGVTSAIQPQLNAKASLSGAAFTGSISTASVDLNAIYEAKSVNAVDVFVYDTSRDSDGGAWRKRCQHTSWYNETLNTEFRGTRREFPAVAVIVATTTTVTIYDGDDTDLPMWMVFRYGQTTGNKYFLGPAAGAFKIAMLNGVLSVGKYITSADFSFYGHFRTANFISEQVDLWIGHYNKHVVVPSVIAKRNDADFGIVDTDSSFPSIGPGIVDGRVRDVAMTVLSDNGLDVATGLPKVDIAVATDGNGTYLASVIRADGNVYDVGADGGSTAVSVSLDGAKLTLVRADGTVFVWNDIGEINADGATPDATYSATSTPAILGTATSSAKAALGSSTGLTLLMGANAGSCRITSTYNTGWLPGDIKGAFLADTDDTDLVGTTAIQDDFGYADDAAFIAGGWTVNSGSIGDANNWTVDGAGNATITAASGNIQLRKGGLTVGETYAITIDFSDVSHGYFNIYAGSSQINPSGITSAGSRTYTFVSTSTLISIMAGTNSTGAISNISVKLADADRSVNNKGLIINGTITRTYVDEV